VLASAGRPPGMRVLLRPGVCAAGPGPCRAMRPCAVRSRVVRWLAGRRFGSQWLAGCRLGVGWLAGRRLGFRRLAGQWSIVGRRVGQAERRPLDRGHDGGQGRAEVRDLLPFFLLLIGSDGSGGQPFAHRAQSAGLRPCLDDAICRVKDRHRTDNANEQVNHEFPSLAEEVFRSFEPMRGRDLRRWWRAGDGWRARQSSRRPDADDRPSAPRAHAGQDELAHPGEQDHRRSAKSC
jgi:hypothetical protein